MSSPEIVACRIHPGIGIARVGNSPNEYFIGPEAPGLTPFAVNGFKDASGCIKRQVARFRVYGLNAAGEIVKELTDADADIVWSVHLANKKGFWFSFQQAMDVPGAPSCELHNPNYVGDRQNLIIDPGVRSVTGANDRQLCEGGEYMGIAVPLGEIRTDKAGRLLVFGGLGESGNVTNQPFSGTAPNPGWYDDISDGPVSATIKIDGFSVPVEPAWVVVGPPDYAPGVLSAVTLYDVIYEVAVNQGWLTPPAKVSFTDHIYPIFHRYHQLQWVNAGFYLEYGWGAPDDFLAAQNLPLLANDDIAYQPLRQRIFEKFRDPDYLDTRPEALPPMYGDGFVFPADNKNPRQWLTMTRLQYGWLKRWAIGDFKPDWSGQAPPTPSLEDLPIKEQPQALDQAALENGLGGAFHPGCELTWIVRQAMLYSGAFRIKLRPADRPEPDFGATLTPEVTLSPNGPLNGSGPGDLTRWMFLPWQMDTGSCGGGYTPNVNPYLPTFWPARVPNHVLTQRYYEHAIDTHLSVTQRLKVFGLRQDWLRDFSVFLGFIDRVNQFWQDWSKVGIVTRQDAPPGHPELPPVLYVERGNALEHTPDDRHLLVDPRVYR